MKIKPSQNNDNSYDDLKQEFEVFIQLLIDDTRDVLGNGKIESIGFTAPDELVELYQPKEEKPYCCGLFSQKPSSVSGSTIQLYGYIADCNGTFDKKSSTIRIPLRVMSEKLAAMNADTAVKTFEMLLEILQQCMISALNEANSMLEYHFITKGSEEREVLLQLMRRWGSTLERLDVGLKLYREELQIDRSQMFFPGFEYVRPGEDEAAMKEAKELLVVRFK